MCDIVDTMFCHCGSVTLCHTVYISGGIHRIEHQVCNKYIYMHVYVNVFYMLYPSNSMSADYNWCVLLVFYVLIFVILPPFNMTSK